ncbi:MAG: glycosyltransferase, partial [Mycobacterium sp.]|nr:glycosyltransferase [Mycobacterium sp.]
RRSIVHITGLRRVFLYPELILTYLAKLRGCRVIYDIRDGLDLDAAALDRSAAYRYFFGRLLNSADLVMVQGAGQIPFVESFTGRTPVLMPNQIDLSAIPARTYGGLPTAPVIAYAGALKPEKGLSTILEAAELLTARGCDVSVRIAGTGDAAFVEDLRSRHAGLAIDWMGAQTAEAVLELFSTSHFFLFPTWWPGEGQSNALTESMACGCVPIVSDHGFNAATVGECGAVLSLDRGPADYADAVQRIWASGQWTDLSQESARRVRENFSSVAVIEHLTAEYAALERGSE